MAVWTIVVAAGTGSRFGRRKQYEPLGGKRVLDWALQAAVAAGQGVVLVVPPDEIGRAEPGADAVVAGGSTRSESVRAGLAAVPPEAEVVLVHDAARPLASVALFERVIGAVRDGADGAVPVVPVSDSLRRRRPEGASEPVDRGDLVAVQTPQGFAARWLREAHRTGAEATDDAALVEAAGGRVVLVDGEAANRKLTHPDDLVVARALVDAAGDDAP